MHISFCEAKLAQDAHTLDLLWLQQSLHLQESTSWCELRCVESARGREWSFEVYRRGETSPQCISLVKMAGSVFVQGVTLRVFTKTNMEIQTLKHISIS